MKPIWQVNPASPEFRALADKQHAENWAPHIDKLNAMLLEARNLRLPKEHKARERTLSSEDIYEAYYQWREAK